MDSRRLSRWKAAVGKTASVLSVIGRQSWRGKNETGPSSTRGHSCKPVFEAIATGRSNSPHWKTRCLPIHRSVGACPRRPRELLPTHYAYSVMSCASCRHNLRRKLIVSLSPSKVANSDSSLASKTSLILHVSSLLRASVYSAEVCVHYRSRYAGHWQNRRIPTRLLSRPLHPCF